jgi:hypothetical protein
MVKQINLKFQDDFFELTKKYANSRGYMSVQELVRESLRDKIFEDLEVREDYKEVLKSKEANTFSSIKDSKEFINKLKKKANLK